MNKIIDVLGTNYTVLKTSESECIPLTECDGFCDQYSKEIVVDTMEKAKNDVMCVRDLKEFQNKVLRHEIIHAFIGESGLRTSSSWAENEEIVDWFAIQFHKIASAFRELDI